VGWMDGWMDRWMKPVSTTEKKERKHEVGRFVKWTAQSALRG